MHCSIWHPIFTKQGRLLGLGMQFFVATWFWPGPFRGISHKPKPYLVAQWLPTDPSRCLSEAVQLSRCLSISCPYFSPLSLSLSCFVLPFKGLSKRVLYHPYQIDLFALVESVWYSWSSFFKGSQRSKDHGRSISHARTELETTYDLMDLTLCG